MLAVAQSDLRGRVLVVDDDEAVCRSYARMLEATGWDVDTVGDGREALDRIRNVEYDAVVSDVEMPGLDGVRLARALREMDVDAPVVLITGAPSVAAAALAVEAGAFRYLLKPVDLPVLDDAVRRATRMKALCRVKREALALLASEPRDVGDRTEIAARFERALGGMWMAFQPIVSWSERRAVAYEALLRTSEPTLASPLDFLAAAERIGRIHELGRAIRARVADAMSQAPTGVEIFVNVHARDLDDEQLGAALLGAAGRVVFEITERVSLDEIANLPRRMIALRDAGYRIAIDDLGAGYAGLSSFTLLEPDLVKVDMSLVRGIDRNPTKQRVVGWMARLCDDMGMRVVCEGIETAGERDALVDLGCDLFQGYLFARPGPGFPAPVL